MYGTNTTLDTLAASQSSVVQFGEDRAFDAIEAAFAAQNQILRAELDPMVETTTDRQRRYGGDDTMVMDELDQFGRAEAQKATAGVTVGFPLRKYGGALQWTRTALQVMTAAQMAAQVTALMNADVKAVQRELKRALLGATNFTFRDRLVDNVDLAVKRLLNADSAAIPPSPSGTSFNSATHTHYLYTASSSLAAADLTGLIETVVEHYAGGEVGVFINRAQETAVRGLTGFTAYLDARIIGATNANQATGRLDPVNLYNRAIGIYAGAEVWVKPWVPAGYLVAWLMGQNRPLARRVRNPGDDAGDLQLVFEDENHPLRAREYEREFGFGVYERAAAAILYVDSGSAGAYVTPTIS